MKTCEFKLSGICFTAIIGVIVIMGITAASFIGSSPELTELLSRPLRDITIGQAFIFAALIGMIVK